MEAAIDLNSLLEKVKTIAYGPHGDLLMKLVDILYEQGKYDDEPLTAEDLEAIRLGEEDIKANRLVCWENLKKELSL